MEWELSLYLITDNVSINHKYIILSARKREKQEHVDHKLGRVQSSVLEGQEREWEGR